MQKRTGVVVGPLLVACFALGSCQLIASLEDRTVGVADTGPLKLDDAGSDVDPCTQADFPPRPPGAAGPDTTSIVFALRSVDFGFDGGTTGSYGFNLDHVCTCPGSGSCVPAGNLLKVCDVAKGIDNNGDLIFQKTSAFFGEAQLNTAFELGISGGLVRIDNYNGQRVDTEVRVAILASLGFEGTPKKPAWDGTDRWIVDTHSLVGGQLSADGGVVAAFADETAWVTNNTVVTSLDFPVTFGTGVPTSTPVTVELTGGVIVATLGTNGQGRRTLSGTIAGRWLLKKMLTSFAVVQDPLDSTQHLCGDDPLYQTLKQIMCESADIAGARNLDNADHACDAVAVGVHFEAVEAQLGLASGRQDAGAPCGPNWTDTCPP